LPKWGVDGKFGPETEEASNGFKLKYIPILKKFKHLISSEKNVLTSDDIKVLYASLLKEGFEESDLTGIQKKADKELSLIEGLTLRINSPFGPRWGRKHRGTDYASVTGNQILVKKPGIVETIETNCKVGQRKCGGRWGNYVLIDHGDNIKTRYAHLSKVFVKKNEEINNTIIGETGNTGGSDGPHLHFEYLLNNERINGAEFANDYFELNGIDSPSFENSKKEVNSKIKNELVTDAEKSEFLEKLKLIAKSDKTFKNFKEDGHIIPYDPDVEIIQTSLQFLGFSLPGWGVDGKFGPETEEASNGFKSKYLNLLDKFKHLISSEKNVLTSDDIKVLFASLLDEGFKESDLSGIQKKSDFSNINIGNDKEFYEEILKCVGAPITDENLKFLYAWRQAEGATANNNPFNTTMPFKNATPYGKNTDGVKEYQTSQDGLEATCKTLNLSYYTCIVDGLIDDIGAERISTECNSALKTWGTHATTPLITKVLKGKIDPPPIATS
jgi:murein DD-endopeptidase MepM/ murein hydrolase activator NlpD